MKVRCGCFAEWRTGVRRYGQARCLVPRDGKPVPYERARCLVPRNGDAKLVPVPYERA